MPHNSRPDDAPHPIDVHVGRAIAEHRKRIGMTQSEVGQAVGVTFQQLQKYERGYNRVSASRLHQIAGVLGLPITAFFPAEGELLAEGQPLLSGRAVEVADLTSQLGTAEQKLMLELARTLARGVT